MSKDSFLKFGDMICLYCDNEQFDGYLCAVGHNHVSFIVQGMPKDQTIATVPNQRSMVFTVHPKLAYNIQNTYNKILVKKQKLQQIPDTERDEEIENQIRRLKEELKVQEPRRATEIANNINSVASSRGFPVLYMSAVQLLHNQSGQYMVMSTKSAEQDKTCQKLDLTDNPSASRVTFQIQPRYKYRQEGDRVVFQDQILLANTKYNTFVNVSVDLVQTVLKDDSVPCEFRPPSPKRRRNPANMFKNCEANISQNFMKLQLQPYRQTDEPQLADLEIHAGDVVRLKHAESGGYITVDDDGEVKNGLQVAYVRQYHGDDKDEDTTINQLFELESCSGVMEDSGKTLSWQDEPETGKQVCRVHLRHFNSGRLLQVTYVKENSKIGQVVTLADSKELEQDGASIYGKKILSKGGKLQNFIFNLYSRSMVSDSVRTLSRESVCNLANAGTKLYFSTQLFDTGGDDEEEEEAEIVETEQERQQREFELESAVNTAGTTLAQRDKRKKIAAQMETLATKFAQERVQHEEILQEKQNQEQNTVKVKIDDSNRIFKNQFDEVEGNPEIAKLSITLKTKGSMNDVFLPIKCENAELLDINMCHSCVPLIKQYLGLLRARKTEELNLPFFISLMELLKGLIFWLVELDSNDYQDPVKLEGYPRKERQKILRETRLFDLLIDCLIYPFEFKITAYDDLTTQSPYTQICRLVYRILKHGVQDYDGNKDYVAQWIDLFFKQAMTTTERNSFFAEKTIQELLLNNKNLLDTQINDDTISALVNLCLTQPKHKRFLDLMANLCSCNGQAIASNQDSICMTILNNEKHRDNKEKMLCGVESKNEKDPQTGQNRLVHYVKIKENEVIGSKEAPLELKVAIEDLYDLFKEKKDLRLYEYFEALINLMAAICMERNYKCIKILTDFYKPEFVIDCTLNPKLQHSLRAKFAKLLVALHMDKDPLEQLNVPVMTRVWDEIEEKTITLPQAQEENMMKIKDLLKLKPAFEKIVRDTNGQCMVWELDFNSFLLEVLNIIETMLILGFYKDEEEMKSMMESLIRLLDGQLDFVDEDEYRDFRGNMTDEELAIYVQTYRPLKKTHSQKEMRYKKSTNNERVVKIKNKIIDICVKIMDLLDNKRLSLFLISFADFDKTLTPSMQKYMQLRMKILQAGGQEKKFSLQLSQTKNVAEEINKQLNEWVEAAFAEKNLDLQRVSELDFVAILLDLNLYEDANLVANAFKLLVRYFTQKEKILQLASEVQVLQDAEEIAVLEQCTEALRQMKKDAENCEDWIGEEDDTALTQARSFIDRMSALTDLNVYRENRVIDLGNKKEKKKKGKSKEGGNNEDQAQFQFLNLSEFKQQWDDEDKRVLTDYDVFDEQNQRLLRNLRAYDISIQIIKHKQLKNAKNKNAYLKVVEKAYIFLIKFVKGNKENQNIILEFNEMFLEDIEQGVHALELITEIFRDSENLLSFPLVPLIKKIAGDIDQLDIETTKKATLLSFVPVFMFYKDQYLKDNQYLILNEFTSTQRENSVQLFRGEDGHEDLKIYMAEMKQQYYEFMNDDKLLPEIDVPPEVSYAITYIQLLSFAAQGKNASCETRAQAVFDVRDVIANMKISDFCYPFKSALLFFLQNAYFDIEKEVTEDFTKVVWQIVEIVVEDMKKFTEVMQRQKRASGGGGAGAPSRAVMAQETTKQEQYEDQYTQLDNLKVDANKNFTFNTAFGKFPVSELMQKYVFEGIFPSMEAFLNLRLPMGSNEQKMVTDMLKLLYMSVPYKSKPIHDRNIRNFVKSVGSIPQLIECGADVNLGQLGISDGEDTGGKIAKVVQISQAQKLKILMKMTRSDQRMQGQLVKEFEQLVNSIIEINTKTEQAFKGANTISVKEFINSLIKSTDVTSDIPTKLRTQSLKIIRKVIESENKNSILPAINWEGDDFVPFRVQIQDAQDMLVKMDLVPLLCRIVSQETKREIREEAMLVCIATLFGGNENSQMAFCKYIQEDIENEFCRAIQDQILECFELIKKNQLKRNQKISKIRQLQQKLAEEEEKDEDQRDEEEYTKMEDQRRAFEDEIKDTEYKSDELRDGEELTLSRAMENINVQFRFLQLLCENHNLALQKILGCQTNIENRPKPKSVNIIVLLARIFEQMIKLINSVNIGHVGNQLVDTIIEVVQGPCKENQRFLMQQKIFDSCREFINMLSKTDNLGPLGFEPPGEDEVEEEDIMAVMDEFISKIATLLVAELEGELDIEILQKMSFSLSVDDLKDRLLNVFGVFLDNLSLYPIDKLNKGEIPARTPLSELSSRKDADGVQFNCLANVSINKINFKLKVDSFEDNIKEAFEIYNLLQNLASGISSCADYVKKEFYTADQWKVFDFLRQNTGIIEVSIDNKLQRVYFPIRPVCHALSEKTVAATMNEVRRESQQTKVQDLMERTPDLIDEMRHNLSRQSAMIKITPTLMAQLKDFSNLVGLFISLSQLFFLRKVNKYREPYKPESISIFIFCLGMVQGISSSTLIAFYIINKFPLITKKGWRSFIRMNKESSLNPKPLDNKKRLTVDQMSIQQTHLILMNKGPQADEFNMTKDKRNFGNLFTKIEAHLFDLYFFLQDFTFIYYVLYFGISFLGFYSNELFYSFHLLDVIPRFPTLQAVCKAVTANYKQLYMTFILILVVMYIYTTVQFFYMMETVYDYNINANDSQLIGENRCDSMLQCFMTFVNLGLLLGGGIGDYSEQIHYSEKQRYFIKFFIDVSFFLLVKIILYNILFGIIIDTFALLRQRKNDRDDDKKNKCYICDHKRLIFDKETEGGFVRHIKQDHNLWNYVYYMVHLDSKEASDYTGIESVVMDQFTQQSQAWMPRQKALCLESSAIANEEEEDEVQVMNKEIQTKNKELEQIIEKLAKIEAKIVQKKKDAKQ